MTDVEYASAPRLRSIIDEFTALAWPADRAVLGPIADRLAWVVRLDLPGSIDYLSEVGASRALVNVLLDEGLVAEVKAGVSSQIDETDSAQQEALADAFTAVVADVQAILGAPAHRRRGEYPRVSWDLPNGGRVAVQWLGFVVQLVVLQKRYADVERFEESRGVSADRDAGADLG
ncbi:DUF6301 family protein [Micromonospora sp. DT81.3]|uniref:DUF6301 family protein n=1 Tax=Micromonospora sp. DT81.3 TaxID=3416523 RepID=UPI003CF16F3A